MSITNPLTSGTSYELNRGYYMFLFTSAASGSSSGTISAGGSTAQDLPEMTFAATGISRVYLPECTIVPTLVGDGILTATPIALDAR